MPVEPIELVFPLRGIDDGWSFSRQPEGTCPDASNVIPYDIIDSRARGGQRWGLSKYYASLHNGANALQQISSIARAKITDLSNDYTEAFIHSDAPFWSAYPGTWAHYKAASASGLTSSSKLLNSIVNADVDSPALVSNILKATYVATDYTTSHIYVGRTLEFSGAYSISYDAIWNGAVLTRGRRAVYLRVNPALNSEMYAVRFITEFWPGTRGQFSIGLLECTASGWTLLETQSTGTNVAISNAMAAGMTITVDVAADGEIKVTLGTLGPTYGPYTFTTKMTSYGSYYGVGFGDEVDSSNNDDFDYDDFVISGSTDIPASQSGRIYKIIAVSGGDIYSANIPNPLDLTVNGENAVATSGRIGVQSAFAKTYFCDGTSSGYKVLNNVTDTVSTWTPTGGSLPASGTTRARYIALYRGRIVLSGMVDDPHNWFMSVAGDPLDWDYGATPSATMAVAGNNTDAGYCPDIITCLAPYSDDLMYIGGDHTIWIMRGDPADRGRIDNISYQTGISGPDAFAFDPNGIFYFFGSGTVWRMAEGGVPEPLSRNRMDATFKDIDLTTNTVHLAWDNVRHGLFIFVVPKTEGATTHYYWDERTDSFWKIAFPNAHGPTTVLRFDGDDPDDNALILGGFDGYLRQVDSSVKDDDGTAVSSYILYPPISRGGSLRNTRLNSITAILDASSDAVVLTTYAEDTIQGAIESSTIRSARSISAGRTKILNRIAGNAIMIKLSNSVDEKAWAIESLVAEVEVIGRTRKNQL